MKNKKAIIIGSGIAGIASAIRLAVQGFEVHVYEKNECAGGKIGYFIKDDFAFDTGPSLFTQPQNIEELFALANEHIENYFTYKKLTRACKYFYEDGVIVEAFTDANDFAKELKEKVSEEGKNVTNYLQRSSELYNNIGEIFLNHSLHKRRTWTQKKIWKAIRAAKPRYIFKNLDQVNKKSFGQQKTVQLFNRFGTYNGSNPFRMPGLFSLIAHLEHNEGIAYPFGGMITIVKALQALALKKGVQFYFNTHAEKIIYHEGKALGITANNENILADVVVSNVDTYFTYKNLLNHEDQASRVIKNERSSSAIVFYWGIKKEFPELQLHNIFFSKNYTEEFHHLFRLKKLYTDPTIYINITSKCELEVHAPKGKENWFVMINAPSGNLKLANEYHDYVKKNIVEKINRILKTDIETLIETEEVLYPSLIEKNTNAYDGALYGPSSNSMTAALLRHPNFSKKIKNLYFVGGTVHPGGGIPLCLKSAKIACEIIAKDMHKQKH